MCRLVNQRALQAGYVLLALVFAAVVVLSFSRTAFIALLVAVFCYQLFVGNYKFAATASIATAFLLGLMVTDFEWDWLVNISRSFTLDFRLWGWRQTVERISEHWVLGYGLRADFEVSWVGTPYEASPPDFFHPHNLFLSIWYQTGIIGLLLTLSMLGLIARKIHQLWYAVEIRYFSCILVFVLAACLVDRPALVDRPTHSWLWFWLPMMVALNADKLLIDRQARRG
jgi:O-antigen ligase